MREKLLLKADRDALWEYWKQANQEIINRRQQLQQSSYLNARERASSCLSPAYYGDPYEALDKIKDVQNYMRGMYMHKDQWQDIRSTLDDAWSKARSRIGEIKEQKRAKYEDWRRRMEDHMDRWEGNIGRAEDAISKIEDNIDKLEDMAANAKTSEFEDRVQGWIRENYEKINDIKRSIRTWEDKIHSAKGRLDS